MLYDDAKNYNKIFLDIGLISLSICCIGINSYAATNATKVNGPGDLIPKETTTKEPETTKGNWGVKIENAQYYDYVEYDDQGRLVDKNRIIIGKGEGGMGQGGGASGDGSKGADSSGTNGSGTSGKTSGKTSGQGGTGKNASGSGGTSHNSISSNAQKQKELADEKARQASVEAKLNNMAAIQKEQESMLNKVLDEARRQSQTAPKVQETKNDTNVMKNKPVQETETIKYEPDQVTKAPVGLSDKATKENQTVQRTTQPKPVFNKEETIPELVIPELPESIRSKTPDQELQEVQSNVPAVTNGPEDMIEETTIIQKETVREDETTLQPTKEKVVETIKETKKKDDAPKDDLKEGDKGEKDHDDEEAEYKKELGDNKNDGKGDGRGGINNGVKILEIDRKGNIGLKATPGINNIQGMIAGAFTGFLLLLGILYYYAPYIFKSKKRKRFDI